MERPSAWNTAVGHELWTQEEPPATTLAILLPGDRYRRDAPLLDYARQVCLQHGCDVLAVEYGHQAARSDLGPQGTERVAAESAAAVRDALQPQYRRLVVVAKSLGTRVAAHAAHMAPIWDERPTVFAFLTPLVPVVPFMRTRGGLIIVGDQDPAFGPEALRAVRATGGLDVRVLAGADHQLLIRDHWRASLAALEATCAGLEDLLAGRSNRSVDAGTQGT